MYKFAGLTQPCRRARHAAGAVDRGIPDAALVAAITTSTSTCRCATGRPFTATALAHLRPLFDMIGAWMPALRAQRQGVPGHRRRADAAPRGGRPVHVHGRVLVRLARPRLHRLDGADDVPLLPLHAWTATSCATRLIRSWSGAMRVYEEMLEREGGRFVAAGERLAGVPRRPDERLGPQRELPVGVHPPRCARTCRRSGRVGRAARASGARSSTSCPRRA